jgi:hypothetical protein
MPGTSALQELEIAIDLCFQERLITPTLALLYSGIDTMAWLGVPDNREDVTGNDFTRWADHYLLPDSGLACTSLDLYSSRCGIVHSMTAESRTIRREMRRESSSRGATAGPKTFSGSPIELDGRVVPCTWIH